MTEQAHIPPRLLTKAQAAAYCGVSLPNFDRLRRLGTLPNRVEGMLRWDIRALDAAIDKLSVVSHAPKVEENPLEAWKKKQEEKKRAGEHARKRRTPNRTPPLSQGKWRRPDGG